jgi:hypothetical protein
LTRADRRRGDASHVHGCDARQIRYGNRRGTAGITRLLNRRKWGIRALELTN